MRLGDVLVIQNRYDEALSAYMTSKDVLEKFNRTDPKNKRLSMDLYVCYMRIGDVLKNQSRYDEALRVYMASKEVINRLRSNDLKSGRLSWDLYAISMKIGDVLAIQGRYDEAHREYVFCGEVCSTLVRRRQENLVWMQNLAYALQGEANALFWLGRKMEAAQTMEQAVKIFAKADMSVGKNHVQNEMAPALGNLSWYLLFAGQPDAAVDAAQRGLKMDPSAVWLRTNLAHGHLLCGRYAEAEKIYLEHGGDLLDDGRRFDQAVLDDFQEFRRNGIEHPDMERIERMLASRP
jgi:tetratricopeptide (TPR) repeat protein